MKQKRSNFISAKPLRSACLAIVWMVITLHLTGPTPARSAIKTWDGSSNGFWNTAANWTGNVVPADGDFLVFPPNAIRFLITNNISNRRVGLITFTGGDYLIRGNPITLTNGISGTQSSGTEIVDLVVTNAANCTFKNIFAGTLLILNTNVVLGSTTLTNFSVGDVEYHGAISGVSGNIVKTGTGAMIFSGGAFNSYSGTTWVNEGTLLLNRPGAGDLSYGPLIIGDGLGGTNADVVRCQLVDQLYNLEPVTINSSGLLDINSQSEAIGALAGSGNVTLGSGAILPGQDNTSTVFTGIISGTGSVYKDGSGTLTFTGDNTYTGITHVRAGTLLVNGSQPLSLVSVTAGATLGGSGTVSNITASGTVSPGNSAGHLTCRNLTFNPGSVFRIELNGHTEATSYDVLEAYGPVNLAGGSLDVSVGNGFTLTENATFHVLRKSVAGAITGTFAGVPEGSVVSAGGLKFSVSYAVGGGRYVSLTFTNPPLADIRTEIVGGNGNGRIDPNECNHLFVVLTNTSGAPMTGISTMLSPYGADHVIITQPNSGYPDVPAGGVVTNITPYQISTLPLFRCGTTARLPLTVNSSVGSFATFVDLLATNCVDGGGFCDTCPGSIVGSITTNDSPSSLRLLLPGTGGSTCAAPFPCPGFTNYGAPFHYRTFNFTNPAGPACVKVYLNHPCNEVYASAYLGGYNPADPCQNYLGSVQPDVLDSFSFPAPGSTNFVVIVSSVSNLAAQCDFHLTVLGVECPPLVLKAASVPASKIRLSWPTRAAGYLLESRPSLSPTNWSGVANQPLVNSGNFNVTNNIAGTNQFFRLRKPLP